MAKKIVNTNGVEDAELIEAPAVTVLPPEIEERVDKEISLAIVEVNYTDDFIRKMKEEFLPMTINGQQDKEGYLNLQAVRKQVKQARILVEKTFKRGREIAQLEVKKWITKQNEIVGEIKSVEKTLEDREDEWEKERDRLKEIERQRIEQQGVARITDMVRFGAQLQGSNWVLGPIEYEAQLVKEADPEIYQTIYNDFEAQFNLNEAEKRAAKEKADREALELKQAQESIRLREQELQAQQEKMAKQLKELRIKSRTAELESLGFGKQVPRAGFPPAYVYSRLTVLISDIEDEDDHDWEVIMGAAKDELEKVKQEIAELERVREVFKARLPLLKEWSSNGQSVYAKGGIWGTVEDLVKMSEDEFQGILKENDAYIRDRNAAKEKQHQIDLENARIEGVGKSRREMLKAINGEAGISDFELGSVSPEQWERDLGIATKLHEKRQKDLADQKEKERQELLGDKQRYEEVVAALKALSIPSFKSGFYRTKIGIIRDFIDGLK
jgi:hypothetical protein